MTFDSPGDSAQKAPVPCQVLPHCVICDGVMETVYERQHQVVCQCVDCASTLTVPRAAWTIAAEKRRTSPAA